MHLWRSQMLGEDLKRVREARGLTVPQLAANCGLATASLYAIERNARYPSLPTLEALAECLQINVIIGPDETVVEW